MLKAGKFQCKVLAPTHGWFGEAGENNTPFLRLNLIVTDDSDCEGEQITFQGWLTDKALDRTIKNLAEVFGWDGDLEVLAKLTSTGPFVDLPCQIVTEEEEYNGKMAVKIKWLNPTGGGGKTMEPDAAYAIAKKFGARAKLAASGVEAPKKKFVDPDLDDDSSIPF